MDTVHEPSRTHAGIRNVPLVRRTTVRPPHLQHKGVLWSCRCGKVRVGEQGPQAGSLRNGLATPLKSVTVPRPTSMRMRSRVCHSAVAPSPPERVKPAAHLLPPLPCFFSSSFCPSPSTKTRQRRWPSWPRKQARMTCRIPWRM